MDLPKTMPFTEEELAFVHRMERQLAYWQYEHMVPEDWNVLITDGKRHAVAKKVDGIWYKDGLPFADEVKYWMPLPWPPKEEND